MVDLGKAKNVTPTTFTGNETQRLFTGNDRLFELQRTVSCCLVQGCWMEAKENYKGYVSQHS